MSVLKNLRPLRDKVLARVLVEASDHFLQNLNTVSGRGFLKCFAKCLKSLPEEKKPEELKRIEGDIPYCKIPWLLSQYPDLKDVLVESIVSGKVNKVSKISEMVTPGILKSNNSDQKSRDSNDDVGDDDDDDADEYYDAYADQEETMSDEDFKKMVESMVKEGEQIVGNIKQLLSSTLGDMLSVLQELYKDLKEERLRTQAVLDEQNSNLKHIQGSLKPASETASLLKKQRDEITKKLKTADDELKDLQLKQLSEMQETVNRASSDRQKAIDMFNKAADEYKKANDEYNGCNCSCGSLESARDECGKAFKTAKINADEKDRILKESNQKMSDLRKKIDLFKGAEDELGKQARQIQTKLDEACAKVKEIEDAITGAMNQVYNTRMKLESLGSQMEAKILEKIEEINKKKSSQKNTLKAVCMISSGRQKEANHQIIDMLRQTPTLKSPRSRKGEYSAFELAITAPQWLNDKKTFSSLESSHEDLTPEEEKRLSKKISELFSALEDWEKKKQNANILFDLVKNSKFSNSFEARHAFANLPSIKSSNTVTMYVKGSIKLTSPDNQILYQQSFESTFDSSNVTDGKMPATQIPVNINMMNFLLSVTDFMSSKSLQKTANNQLLMARKRKWEKTSKDREEVERKKLSKTAVNSFTARIEGIPCYAIKIQSIDQFYVPGEDVKSFLMEDSVKKFLQRKRERKKEKPDASLTEPVSKLLQNALWSKDLEKLDDDDRESLSVCTKQLIEEVLEKTTKQSRMPAGGAQYFDKEATIQVKCEGCTLDDLKKVAVRNEKTESILSKINEVDSSEPTYRYERVQALEFKVSVSGPVVDFGNFPSKEILTSQKVKDLLNKKKLTMTAIHTNQMATLSQGTIGGYSREATSLVMGCSASELAKEMNLREESKLWHWLHLCASQFGTLESGDSPDSIGNLVLGTRHANGEMILFEAFARNLIAEKLATQIRLTVTPERSNDIYGENLGEEKKYDMSFMNCVSKRISYRMDISWKTLCSSTYTVEFNPFSEYSVPLASRFVIAALLLKKAGGKPSDEEVGEEDVQVDEEK